MILFRGREAHSRSFAKAVSWRILGSLDTFALSWFFTGSAKAAGAIAVTEVLTKIVLYYFHERAWAHVSWGFAKDDQAAGKAA
ncbi:DUF2061 domain-containing protein [Qipengyuania sp. 1XM1-15A]|uniref:DUF2061 domain-containing protein n=1 Tax=Qipengyuania xiamenensis TaxID=2867237 RepID=UPI001C86C0FB|nr:DUF2061 domain-containing protein [Qipengyuania xiamenensis]MBX7533247.1 DUF2061 domain-containing protein [Qipengyuania xiamenensis]